MNLGIPGIRKIHSDPDLYEIQHFLTDAECDEMMGATEDSLFRSPVVGEGSGVETEERTSMTCFLAKEEFPFLCQKVSHLVSKPVEHLELPQVGRSVTICVWVVFPGSLSRSIHNFFSSFA